MLVYQALLETLDQSEEIPALLKMGLIALLSKPKAEFRDMLDAEITELFDCLAVIDLPRFNALVERWNAGNIPLAVVVLDNIQVVQWDEPAQLTEPTEPQAEAVTANGA